MEWTSDRRPLPLYLRSTQEYHDTFWPKIEPKLPTLKTILSTHFNLDCSDITFLGEGMYARAYSATLDDGTKVVIRVVLPVREGFKTQSEVATMDFIRGRVFHYTRYHSFTLCGSACTLIPIPKVHLYCSTHDNPVGAEWIAMEYLSGTRFGDCFDNMTDNQRRATASDLANIMATLFAITSTSIGTILHANCLRKDQCSLHFGPKPVLSPTHEVVSSVGRLTLGLCSDLAFIDPLDIIPPALCGPFNYERQYMEAVAFARISSSNSPSLAQFRREPYEKVLELYDMVRPLYTDSLGSSSPALFHFCHADLTDDNILLDRSTGHVTGVLDWELAGFKPAWLAARTENWFDDDCHRFTMATDQDGPEPYDSDEKPEFMMIRQHFLDEVLKRSPALHHHLRRGVELRAMRLVIGHPAPSESQLWIKKYAEHEWDTFVRGPFPFDTTKWMVERLDLFER
jgi:hypothetical protein